MQIIKQFFKLITQRIKPHAKRDVFQFEMKEKFVIKSFTVFTSQKHIKMFGTKKQNFTSRLSLVKFKTSNYFANKKT